MKRSLFASGCVVTLLISAAAAQTNGNAAWLGVWQGKIDGQPCVTLTLADDSGSLGGTVVFNRIERQEQGQAHVTAIEPHVLLHMQADEKILSFQVMRPDHSEQPLQFTVAQDGNGKAQIHCLNCGADAPVAELLRAR
jgi:hypothetical protein